MLTMSLLYIGTFPFNPHNNLEVGSSITSLYRQRQGTEKRLTNVTEMAKPGRLVPEPMLN